MVASHLALERGTMIRAIYIKILTKLRFRATASRIRSRSLRSLQPHGAAAIENRAIARVAAKPKLPSKPSQNILPYRRTWSYRGCLSSFSPIAKARDRERDLFPCAPHLLEGNRKHERMERTSSISIVDIVATIAEGNSHPTSGQHIGMRLSSTCLRLPRLYHGCIGLAMREKKKPDDASQVKAAAIVAASFPHSFRFFAELCSAYYSCPRLDTREIASHAKVFTINQN